MFSFGLKKRMMAEQSNTSKKDEPEKQSQSNSKGGNPRPA